MFIEKKNKILLTVLAFLLFSFFPLQNVYAVTIGNEFPIATTIGEEFAASAVFDGTNYLVAVQGDEIPSERITAQFLSQDGSLVGPRIVVGRTGIYPQSAFDGTNFLLVWSDDANYPNNDIYGQFISTSGALVGSPFTINTAAGKQELASSSIIFDGTNYLVTWQDGRVSIGDQGPWYAYGQIISKSGSLLGGEIQISTAPALFPTMAFDGTNSLVVWVDDTNDSTHHGQFISKSGSLVGTNFLIDNSAFLSDNPNFIFFDGTRYVVNVADNISPEAWGHYIRFVDTNGTVSDARITLYEGQTAFGAFITAYDGVNYFAQLSEGWGGPPITSKGRFYDYNINPVGDWFVISETQASKVPMTSVMFDGTKFLTLTTRALIDFSGADVFGRFIYNTPTPDIKVNGTDGPLDIGGVAIPISITVALISGDSLGDNADWWLIADTPTGWYRYNAGSGSWVPGQSVSYQGALFDLATFEVLNISALPIGTSTFYFGVDTVMNGSLNMDQIFYDSVDVNVFLVP